MCMSWDYFCDHIAVAGLRDIVRSRLGVMDGDAMIWMLPLALVLVLIARVGIWLFPEPAAPPKHYEGDFGDQGLGDPLKGWDALTTQEKDEIQPLG